MGKRKAEKHDAGCGFGVRVDAISHCLKRINLESRRVDVKRACLKFPKRVIFRTRNFAIAGSSSTDVSRLNKKHGQAGIMHIAVRVDWIALPKGV